MQTVITLRFNRLLTMEESAMLMATAGELGATADGFKLETFKTDKPEDKRMKRCSQCGIEVGTKKSLASWFWDVQEGRIIIPVALCGKCNGSITPENRKSLLEEMRSD